MDTGYHIHITRTANWRNSKLSYFRGDTANWAKKCDLQLLNMAGHIKFKMAAKIVSKMAAETGSTHISATIDITSSNRGFSLATEVFP